MSILIIVISLLLSSSALFAGDLVSCGSIIGSTGADVTAAYPTIRAANDIFLLEVLVRDQDDTLTLPAGWTQLATADRSTVSRYWWYWLRYDGTGSDVLVDKSTATGDTFARVCMVRGAPTTGDPFNVVGSPETGTADPAALTQITTTVANALVVAMVLGEDDNNATITTTGTDPATYNIRYSEDTSGSDGAATFSSRLKETAGATGTISVDWDVAVPVGWGGLVVAVTPAGIGAVDPTLANYCEGNSTSAGTTVACTTSINAPAGRLVVVGASKDNASSSDGNTNECSSVADSGSNTWTKIYEYTFASGAANAGATVCSFYSVLTNAIAASGTITLTISDTRTAKAIVARQFTLTGNPTINVLTSAVQTENLDGVDAGSLSTSSLTSKQHLHLRFAAFERAGSSITVTSQWSAFPAEASDAGSDEPSMEIVGEYIITSSTGETSDPTILFSISHDGASFLIPIEQVNRVVAPIIVQ